MNLCRQTPPCSASWTPLWRKQNSTGRQRSASRKISSAPSSTSTPGLRGRHDGKQAFPLRGRHLAPAPVLRAALRRPHSRSGDRSHPAAILGNSLTGTGRVMNHAVGARRSRRQLVAMTMRHLIPTGCRMHREGANASGFSLPVACPFGARDHA